MFDLQSNYYQLSEHLFVQYRDYVKAQLGGYGIEWDEDEQRAVCYCKCDDLAAVNFQLNIVLDDNTYNVSAVTFVTETGRLINHQCVIDIY